MIPKRKFVFVRHGEAEGNVRKLCQGWIDFPLTERGRTQAADAASILTAHFHEKVHMFCSGLTRAHETAKIIAQRLCCRNLEVVPSLIERGWGVLDGGDNRAMFAQEIREQDPEFREPSGIEGLEECSTFHSRIEHAMIYILNRAIAEDHIILVVGHGRFFRSLCLLLDAKTHTMEYAVQLPHATPVLFAPHKGGWHIGELNLIRDRDRF